MNKTTARPVLLVMIVFLSVNTSFVVLNFWSDTVPVEWVKHRINSAIKRHNITTDAYPLFRYGLPSIYSLIGIDQISDCMIYLHALYRDEDALKNAIVPGYQDIKNRDHTNLCLAVAQISGNEIEPDNLAATHKIRLWHGAKTILLLALPKLNFFQINMLLKQITYVTYCLLAFAFFYYSRKTGLAFLPIAVTGIFASGITVFGGVAHSLPYLTALATALGLAVVPPGRARDFTVLWAVAMGSVLAFFYQVDGSLMLAFGLIVFAGYFHSFAHSSMREKWLGTGILLSLFAASVLLSLVYKQLISFVYFDAAVVWADFVGEIKYRMYGEFEGSRISPMTALATQFKRYYFAVLNWHSAANFLKLTGTWGWLPVAAGAIWLASRRRTAMPLSDMLAFALIAGIVIIRYLVMANHSQIHTLFVSRYLFLMFGATWAALLWMIWSFFEQRTESEQG